VNYSISRPTTYIETCPVTIISLLRSARPRAPTTPSRTPVASEDYAAHAERPAVKGIGCTRATYVRSSIA